MSFRLSLRYRIAGMIFLLEAIMLAFVLWQTLAESQAATRSQLAANEQAMLHLMAGITRPALLTEEYADLQPYLEDALNDPRVVRVAVADHAGRVVAGTRTTDIGTPVSEVLASAIGEHRYWQQRDLSNAAGPLGTLAIEFSNEALLAAYAKTRNQGITIALIGMTIIAIAGVLVGTLLTRRLEQSTLAAQTIARGETAKPLKARGNDEAADLARAFNTMIERLADEQHKTAQAQASLERRVRERTRELELSNRELQAFSYSVSHDLRAPLRAVDGFSRALLDDYGDSLDDTARDYLGRICGGAKHMAELIDALLQLSRVSRQPLHRETVDLTALAMDEVAALRRQHPDRSPVVEIEAGLITEGDRTLLQAALQNLIGNAWKFTAKRDPGHIHVGCEQRGGRTVYYVRDDGAGFDMKYSEKLFGPFQRLHDSAEYEGTGIGLATVQRIVQRHHGQAWAEGEAGRGATFYFTLGAPLEESVSGAAAA